MTRYLAGLVVLVVSATAVVAGCSTGGGGSSVAPPSLAPTSPATSSGAPASGAPSTGPAGSGTASGACPTSQPPALGAGQKRVVTIETAKGKIQITIEADLSPIAAGNFVALADCGFYDGLVFHRVVPDFVIQGGDPEGTGRGGPGYTIKDEPVTATYARGTVAMARNNQPDSQGSQFFVVLSDGARPALESANTDAIMGHVTSGMDVVDAIAAMPNSGEPNNAAVDPVPMSKVTVNTP
jgi:peptidyl-prolyl cis-trans isomerase B (cyclophilin B)